MSSEETVTTKGEVRRKLEKLIALARDNASEGERDNACRAIGRLIVDHPFLMKAQKKRRNGQLAQTLEVVADTFLSRMFRGFK